MEQDGVKTRNELRQPGNKEDERTIKSSHKDKKPHSSLRSFSAEAKHQKAIKLSLYYNLVQYVRFLMDHRIFSIRRDLRDH